MYIYDIYSSVPERVSPSVGSVLCCAEPYKSGHSKGWLVHVRGGDRHPSTESRHSYHGDPSRFG